MAEKKNDSGFTVTDRRLFTADGELRKDVAEDNEPSKAGTPASAQKLIAYLNKKSPKNMSSGKEI